MKINRILLCTFAAAAICACQTEKINDATTVAPEYKVSFVADIESDSQSKATIATNESGKVQTFWENGDKVLVYSEGNGASNSVKYAFETVLNSPSTSAVFGYNGDGFVEGEHYMAIYPATESSRAANFTNTRMAQVDVPSSQKLVAGGFDKTAAIMLAYSDNLNSMKFMNAVALVKFKVADAGVTAGSISAKATEIAGRFRGDVVIGEDGTYSTALVKYSSGSTNSPTSLLNFSMPDGSSLVPGEEYYVAVRPTVLEDGFSISLNDEYIKNYYISEFKRNVIYDLGTLSLPQKEEEETGDAMTLSFDFSSKTPLPGWPAKDGWTGSGEAVYNLDGVDYQFLCTDCTDATSKRVFWNSNGYIVLNATGRYLGLPAIEGYRLATVAVKHATSAKSRKVGIAAEIVDSKSTPAFVQGGDLLAKTFAVGEVVTFNLTGTEAGVMYYLYTASGIGFSNITLTYEPVGAAKVNSVRIGTYNLRYINSTDAEENQWEVRKTRVKQSIADNDFDVFAIQECSAGIKTYLEAELASVYGGSYFNPFEGKTTKVEYIGILYKKDKYTLSDWQQFWLADDITKIHSVSSPNDMSGESTFYRGGCCGVLTDADGKKIFVVSTHGCLDAGKRKEFAPIFAEVEKKYNPNGYPAFLLGDMNARPTDDASVEYRKYWNDVYREVAPDQISGPFATYNGFDLDRDLNADPKRLDYVYYRNATPINYVCNSRKYDGLYASDHLPVYADFVLP